VNSTLKILNLRIFAIAVLVAVWAVQLHGQDAKTQMPIDLNTVMKLAGANNLRVAEMDARRELAIAEAKTAKEWFLPTISPGVLLVGYEGNAQATDGTFIDVNKNSFWGGAAITADWNLGDAVFSYLEAKQDIKTAEYATAAESNRVQLEAVKTYYELGAAQGKLTALNKIVKKAADITRQIEFQVEAGIRYKSDVLLAKANLNHVKIEQSNARWEILSTSNELLNILNIKDDVVLIVSDSVLVPIALVDTSIANYEKAYALRPETMMFQSKMDALAIGRKSSTTGLLLPDLNLGFNDGLFGPYFNPLVNEYSYYIGAKWNIPLGVLFFGGNRKQYDARIKMEQIHLDQAKNTIKREVLDAEGGVAIATEQMKLATEALGYATAALEQSMERQKLGTSLPLEVFQAQEQLLQSEIDNIRAITNYNQAQYSLYIAMGNKQ
jgi:outer membrane protein TolC